MIYPTRTPIWKKGNLSLLLKEGAYPYNYMDSLKKLDETTLPPKQACYSKLSGEGIGDEDYEHAQKVWMSLHSTKRHDNTIPSILC